MSGLEIELVIMIGGGALGLGALLSAVYYFARFGLKNLEEPSPEEQQRLEALKREAELQKTSDTPPVSTESAAPSTSEKISEPQTPSPAPQKEVSFSQALSKTRNQFFGRVERLFSSGKALEADEVKEGLEEILYTSDLGPKTVSALLEKLEDHLSLSELAKFDRVKQEIHGILEEELSGVHSSQKDLFEGMTPGNGLQIWMIVGVNGVGKTTTIGKLAHMAASHGLKVLVAAGDTFRAAAQNQLKVWADRAQVEIFSPPGVTDPAAVAFDAVQTAKSKGFDLVLIDTAGRLHTQANLMEELKKVKRVISKVVPEGPSETLIVLDANSGQNALVQARQFNEAVALTGAVVAKMDGTSKGGVIVGLSSELKLPTRMIGVGEAVSDLRPFDPKEFVTAIWA